MSIDQLPPDSAAINRMCSPSGSTDMAKWMSKKLAIWGENGPSLMGVASAVSGSML